MSFDYLSDLFGKFRGGKNTKFTDIEKRSKALLIDFYYGRLSDDVFDKSFKEVIDEFRRLMNHEVTEDTPLWLNRFASECYLRWQQWRVLKKEHVEHPEKFTVRDLEARFRRIEAMKYDDWFRTQVRKCLVELDGSVLG